MTEPRRVLVAEDNELLQKLARRALESKGYAVAQALNGAELLNEMMGTLPDVIVLDITLPDADGGELLTRLKADPRTASIPILVWSGNVLESDRHVMRALGAHDCLEKGPPSKLVAQIALLFEHGSTDH